MKQMHPLENPYDNISVYDESQQQASDIAQEGLGFYHLSKGYSELRLKTPVYLSFMKIHLIFCIIVLLCHIKGK